MILNRLFGQMKNPQERCGKGDLISEFDAALKSGSRARRLDNDPIGIENNPPGQAGYALQEILFAIEHEEPTSFRGRRISQAIEKGYIMASPRLRLLPVSGLETLIHHGALRSREGAAELTFDNLLNLRRFGVFGNPSLTSSIYLQQPNSDIAQNSSYWCEKGYPYRAELVLDAKIIASIKPIYLDPETILPNPWYDTLSNFGQSFFVMGGIPKEAIISYRFPNYSPAP